MKSKKNIKSIVMLSFISIIALFCINTSLAANTAKITVETANLREEANSSSKILILLPINEEVEILAKEGGWYKVKAQGVTGYLRNDIIKLNETQEETKPVENEKVEEQKETQGINENTEQQENKSEPVNVVAEEVNTKITTTKKKVKETVKLKIIPAINATDIIEVKQNEEVKEIEKINGWVCIEVGITKGWIREDKLTEIKEEQPEEQEATENPEEEEREPEQTVVNTETVLKTLYVNSELVNVRKEASISAEVLKVLKLNTSVDIYAEANGWYKVKLDESWGYISTSLLSTTKKETTTSRSAENIRTNNETTENENKPVADSTSGQSVVETAKQYIGSKYVYGGSSPNGFDCSGFTQYVYKMYGVNLNRTAAGQYSNGTAVSRSELQQGDLIMFGSSSSNINHVGIYIGGGQIVHAANASR